MSKQSVKFELDAVKPSTEEIAVVAYSFFEAAGHVDGHDLEHWLRAQEQLSKNLSSGDKSQIGAKTGNLSANSNAGWKALVVRTVHGKREDRHAKASVAR